MERFEVEVGPAGDGGERVVTVRGELDLAVAESLSRTLEPLLRPGAVVVLDGTDMTFLDSSGLRALLQTHKRAESAGAFFRVVAAQLPVRRVLELAGADTYLKLRPDVPSAIEG
jgi:anti-sigma B factor antagonist